jgi:hypothetical protein
MVASRRPLPRPAPPPTGLTATCRPARQCTAGRGLRTHRSQLLGAADRDRDGPLHCPPLPDGSTRAWKKRRGRRQRGERERESALAPFAVVVARDLDVVLLHCGTATTTGRAGEQGRAARRGRVGSAPAELSSGGVRRPLVGTRDPERGR